MRKVLVLASAVIALALTTANAETPKEMVAWTAKVSSAIETKKVWIDFFDKAGARCDQLTIPQYRDTCKGSLTFCATMRGVEKIILENWLARQKKPQDAEIQLFDSIDALTTKRCDPVVDMFRKDEIVGKDQ